MMLCQLELVTKRYGGNEPICPVENLSLEINKSDFISIEGPSGIGKSTLLYLIGGLIHPTGGKIIFNGQELTSMNNRQSTEWRRTQMGFIFQETTMFAALTARENLIFAQRMQKKLDTKTCKNQADYYLDLMGLSDRADFLPNELSVGQRRRLIIARTMLQNPPLILADEPTNDLDNLWADKVISMFEEKSRLGTTVIMVTHNEKWAVRAHTRYALANGILASIN